MIFLSLCLLPSVALFMPTIWPFGPPPPSAPTVVVATQGALIQMERCSEYWCLHLNRSKCEVSFFSADSHQANLQPHLFSFPASVSIPLQLPLGSPSIVLFLFLNMYPRSKPSSFSVSRPCAVSLRRHGVPLKSSCLFCIMLFFGPFSHMLHPYGFLCLELPAKPNWNAFTERLVTPSSAASHPLLSHFSSRGVYLSSTSHLTHFTLLFYEWALCPPTSFPISNLAIHGGKPRLQILLKSFCVHSLALAFSLGGFLCLPFSFSWNLPSFTVKSTLSFPRHPFDPLFLAKVRLSLTLTLSSTSRSHDLDR